MHRATTFCGREDDRVIGVITETDTLKAFGELFARGYFGLHLTLEVHEKKGVLGELCRAIYWLGGGILKIGSFFGNGSDRLGPVVKVRDVGKDQMVHTLEALGDHVMDAQEV